MLLTFPPESLMKQRIRGLLKSAIKSGPVRPMAAAVGRLLSFAGYRVLAAADLHIVAGPPTVSFGTGGIWIDVGAHNNPLTPPEGVRLYAFEPTISLANQILGRPRTTVIAAAVSDTPGIAQFHTVNDDNNNSLLPLDADALSTFAGLREKRTGEASLVPVVRLDDFMSAINASEVDFLKVDTEGNDLAVLRSLGRRIRDIRQIQVEAFETPQYVGAENTPQAMTAFMEEHGFRLCQTTPIFFGQGVDLTFERITDWDRT